MERRITATELARRLGDILGRIRYQGESFTVERNGKPVARLTPIRGPQPATAAGAFALTENNLYTVEAFKEYAISFPEEYDIESLMNK